MIHLPPHAPGMRVGLYGGSFDPAHDGHRRASLLALRRLKLDRVWWLVTPGNPLKGSAGLPATASRVEAAKSVAAHPRIAVSGFEAEIGSRYTLQTLTYLVRRCPEIRFVWIMGADSLAGFQRWRGWARIARLMPIAIIDRPGFTLKATSGPAALALARWRRPERAAGTLAGTRAPAWLLLHGPRSPLSSTSIRARQGRAGERRH